MHGASAGELAGSIPILTELRRLIPDLELVVTYSSPSGEEVAADIRPDMHWFVPFDRPDHAGAVLDALRPDAVVFAKLDVWPTFTREAARRKIPIGMINATVRPRSGRLRFPGRQLLRTAYGQLDAVGAASEGERERLIRLGVSPAAIQITGDGSFDRAIDRVQAAQGGPARLPERAPGIVRLLAGSTWPTDESFLLKTLSQLPQFELVLVPHEPTPEAITRLEEEVMRRFGTPARVWSRISTGGIESSGSSPLIVDAVGVLAELYTEADIAYVGGGLDGTGLHSVVEPAAAGLPVLFGARHDRWEAHELVAVGGALELDESNVAAEIGSLRDSSRRASMATAGRAYVTGMVGAGRAGADLVASLLNRG
jgi:3-deoxy-D-manno-octulosonic-acid transferase